MTAGLGTGYHSGAQPGWYPDPTGDFELRWWDGTVWTDGVATGGWQTSSPVVPREQQRLPGLERTVWEDTAGQITTHRVIIVTPGVRTDEFALWMVERSRSRTIDTVGEVEITIGYPGYAGKATHVLRRVPAPLQVAATLHTWVNRAKLTVTGQV